jgi:hypothetical protein
MRVTAEGKVQPGASVSTSPPMPPSSGRK